MTKSAFYNPENLKRRTESLGDSWDGGCNESAANQGLGISNEVVNPTASNWSREEGFENRKGCAVGEALTNTRELSVKDGFEDTPTIYAPVFTEAVDNAAVGESVGRGTNDSSNPVNTGDWLWAITTPQASIIYEEGFIIDDGSLTGWSFAGTQTPWYGPQNVFGQSTMLQPTLATSNLSKLDVQMVTPAQYDPMKPINFYFWVNWAGVSDNFSIEIFLYSGRISGTNSNTKFTFTSGKNMQNGWNVISIPSGFDMETDRFAKGAMIIVDADGSTAQWENGGSPLGWQPADGIDGIIVRLPGVESNTFDGDPYAFVWGGVTYGTRQTAVVLPVFDDGYSSPLTVTHPNTGDANHWGKTVVEYSIEKNIPFTMTIIPRSTGSTNYLTVAQGQELLDAGWSLGLHGATPWGDSTEWGGLVANAIGDASTPPNATNPYDDSIMWNKAQIESDWGAANVDTDMAVYPENNYRGGGYSIDNWAFNLREQMQSVAGVKLARTSWAVRSYFSDVGGDDYQFELMSLGGDPMEAAWTGGPYGYMEYYIDNSLRWQVQTGSTSAPYFHQIVTKTTLPDTNFPGAVPSMQSPPADPTSFYIEDLFDIMDEWARLREDNKLIILTMKNFSNKISALPGATFPCNVAGVPATDQLIPTWDAASIRVPNGSASSGYAGYALGLDHCVGADAWAFNDSSYPANLSIGAGNGYLFSWVGTPPAGEYSFVVRATNTVSGNYADVTVLMTVDP